MSSRSTPCQSTPVPARLALSLSDPGSSGLIDVADLRAEPLPLSLVSAGLTSTPPPTPPTPPRAWGLWLLGSAAGLAIALTSLVVAVQPTPTVVVERPVAIERQLSMQEAEATPVMTAVEHDERPGKTKTKTKTKTPDPDGMEVEPTPSKTTSKRRRGSTRSDSQRRPGKVASTPGPAPTEPRSSIPIECVLDPASCTKSGSPKTTHDPGPSSPPEARPHKLSTSQLKQGLATTKADARRCGPMHGAELGTKVRVKLSIDGKTGMVVSATAQDGHAQSALGRCVAKALGRTVFPRFTAARMGTIYSIRL